MTTKKINLKLVGVALLPALAVSVAVILLGKAVGFDEAAAERVSQTLFFPLFLGACHAWRHRFDREWIDAKYAQVCERAAYRRSPSNALPVGQ